MLSYEKMKLIWIWRNNVPPIEIKKPHLARLMNCSVSLLYSIEKGANNVSARSALKLDQFIESMRQYPRLKDASFLIPQGLHRRWRWATFDVPNGWTIWDCLLPPLWEVDRKIWTDSAPRSEPSPNFSPRDLFPQIPADESGWVTGTVGEAVYKRDPISGLWVKTFGNREANPIPELPYNREKLDHLEEYYS